MNLDLDKRTYFDRMFQEFQTRLHEFQEFCNHVLEVSRFEDARSIQISAVVTKRPEKAAHLPQIKVKKRPICREFQVRKPIHMSCTSSIT